VASSKASAVVSAATAEQALGSAANIWSPGSKTPGFCVLLLLLLLLLGGLHHSMLLSLQLPVRSAHT
jgi:hypothetical protein